jgi:hypothetical protein
MCRKMFGRVWSFAIASFLVISALQMSVSSTWYVSLRLVECGFLRRIAVSSTVWHGMEATV